MTDGCLTCDRNTEATGTNFAWRRHGKRDGRFSTWMMNRSFISHKTMMRHSMMKRNRILRKKKKSTEVSALWGLLFSLSVQFGHSVMSNSLWPPGLQHARPPCPSSTPGIYSKSCPLSQWCHPTISFSVVPFSCLQPFPASGPFPMSQFFTSGECRVSIWMQGSKE